MTSQFNKTLFHLRSAFGVYHLASKLLRSLSISEHFFTNTCGFSSDAAESASEHSFTVSYLINSCGLSLNSAFSASKLMHFQTPKKADSVLSMLKTHGFSKVHIAKLVSRSPRLILCNPQKYLLPKFEFFYSKGLQKPELASILSLNPNILQRSLKDAIIPSFESVVDLVQIDNKDAIIAVIRILQYYRGNLQARLVLNIKVLKELGVRESIISYVIIFRPAIIIAPPAKLKEALETVNNMGFNSSKSMFGSALGSLLWISKSARERKVNAYKKWGLSDEEILIAFRRFPQYLTVSDVKMRVIMDILVNQLGLESSIIVKRPVLLGLSLEKRVLPRCSVLKILLSKGLINKKRSGFALLCPERLFLEKFVTCYEVEAPQLLKIYQEQLGRVT